MDEQFIWIPTSLQAAPAGITRPMRHNVCKCSGSKVKRLDLSPDLDAILECLQGIAADHSWPTNNLRKSPTKSPVLDHPLVESMIGLLSSLPLPSQEEEILQAFRPGYRMPPSAGSLVLMGFIPCWSLKGGVMSLLSEVLEASQDGTKITHSPVLLGRVHPYDQNPRKLESLFVNQATRTTVDEHDAQEQFNLDSIRRLKNTVKTDLKKYCVYLMGLNSRLRNLERQAATVTRDLERANIELEALKQKNCALGVLKQESHSQKLACHLKCHPIITDFQNQMDRSDLLWYDNLHHLKPQPDIHVNQPPKHHRPEDPSARTTKSRGLLTSVLHCQAHIDTLMDQLNKQIMKTEVDILAGAKHLIQARRDRREKRKKPVPDLRRLSCLTLSQRN